MADVSTPSAIAMSTIGAGSDSSSKPARTKPEKPSESEYKETLSQAERTYVAAQEKFVRKILHPSPHEVE